MPKYIKRMPETGISESPNFHYARGTHRMATPWFLSLRVPGFFIGYDRFVYYSDEAYPTDSHGPRFEKVGKWAYVHE